MENTDNSNIFYVCQTCGVTVPLGEPHTCGTQQFMWPNQVQNYPWSDTDRIVAELSRIADALEKIERKI